MRCLRLSIPFAGCLLEFLFLASACLAQGLEEFAYRPVQIKLVGLDNRPVAGARVYGYCRDLQLIWPEAKGVRSPWKAEFLGTTRGDGSMTARVPNQKWAFFACGLGTKQSVVAAWTDYQTVDSDSVIVLRPRTGITLSFHLSAEEMGNKPVEHNRLYLKPAELPIFIPVEVPSRKAIRLQVPENAAFDLWGQGIARPRSPAFVVNWGRINSADGDGDRKPAEPPAVYEFDGTRVAATVNWQLPWIPGLTGAIAVRPPTKLLLAPGRYQLGYRRRLGNSQAEFAAKRYDVSSSDAHTLQFGDALRTGLESIQREDKISSRLFVVDENNHLLRNLSLRNGELLEIRARVKTPDGIVEAAQAEAGMFYFNAKAQGAEMSEWQFAVPGELFRNKVFQREPHIEIFSEHFRTSIPPVLKEAATNLLAQYDEVEDRMRATSGRTKSRFNKTNLIINVAHPGASATHNGRYIRMNYGPFFRDAPAMEHTFGHELGHNFGLTHGGLHEMIVEAARSADAEILDGQSSKWLFIDRMNGSDRQEKWYPPTGIYLYAYSQGGEHFLRLMSQNEVSLRKQIGTKGIDGGETIAALMEIALNRSMQAMAQRYGLSKSTEKYAAALTAAKELVRSVE